MRIIEIVSGVRFEMVGNSTAASAVRSSAAIGGLGSAEVMLEQVGKLL